MTERFYLQGTRRRVEKELLEGSFIFDANVWLSVSGPYPDDNAARAAAYSGFFKALASAGGRVLVPQLIATEFINRCIRIQAQTAGCQNFRKIHTQPGYSEWIKESCDLLNSIVDGNVRVSDSFESLDLEPCLQSAEAGGLEFHDVLIAETCRRESAILVTDDADFSGHALPIVTWNTRLT